MARPRRQRRLTIPRRIVLGGRAWRVVRTRTLRRREGAVGLCDSDVLTIQIDSRQNRHERELTFVHELLHGLMGDAPLSEAEERIVSRLEAPLHALLVSGQLVAVPVEEVR